MSHTYNGARSTIHQTITTHSIRSTNGSIDVIGNVSATAADAAAAAVVSPPRHRHQLWSMILAAAHGIAAVAPPTRHCALLGLIPPGPVAAPGAPAAVVSPFGSVPDCDWLCRPLLLVWGGCFGCSTAPSPSPTLIDCTSC